MGYSALVRRWITGIFRSGAEVMANRMITSRSGGGSSVEPPWMMIRPHYSEARPIFRFWCCAKNDHYSFFNNEHKSGGGLKFDLVDITNDFNMQLVGSSQGWLALYDMEKHMYLLDPTTHRDTGLPPLIETMRGEQVHSVILSDEDNDDDEREWKKIFVTFGSGHRLAFCSPRHGWTLLGGGGGGYDSVVYSSIHRRLFCFTSTFKLEAWDVGGEEPRLDNDWATEFDSPPDPDHNSDLAKLKYLVCEEQTGELFVVVRHVNLGGGSWVEVGAIKEYKYPTVDFEVYMIDRDRRRLVKMKDSLQGLTVFVGINHPIAIKGVAGLKPNSVYFTYDNRVADLELSDRGIFDYQKGLVSPLSPSHPVDLPVWFTPFCRHRNSF